jgi:hypothetical protein
MDRYITFNNIGARVIKGNYTPKKGEVFVKNPSSVPVCSIHYWKYENGQVVEMNEGEKSIIDYNIACLELHAPKSTNIKQVIQSDIQTVKAITEIDVENKIKEELAKIPVYQIEDFLKHKANLKEDLEKFHKLSWKQILGIVGVSGITYLLIHILNNLR